jgi:hypothetical protein
MNPKLSPQDLEKPALKVAGFQLWIHGRQFPDSDDYHDGNWLRVTAHCGASGASVWAQGAIVMATDIARFGEQCDAMLHGNSCSAVIDPFEPELRVSLEAADSLGHIRAKVEITPDHLAQSHKMEFDVDQSCLPLIIEQCSKILQEYPIRGSNDKKDVWLFAKCSTEGNKCMVFPVICL